MKNDPYPKIYIEQTDADISTLKYGYKRYHDFKLLTEGGTASIQTCLDRNLGRKVAFKTLLPHVREDLIEQKRFMREARVTAMLQHPNTPPVYELGLDDNGDLYFTMKLIMGQTLRNIINKLSAKDRKTENEFTLNRMLGALIQASNAIAFAHEHGVIHRDVKPANVQIGSFGEVLVLDWGLAKVWDMPIEEELEDHMIDKQQSLRLTVRGKRQGTPLYMSPEQARGDYDVDERTDIYSLGCILYEMMTLENMIWGKSVTDVMIRVKAHDIIIPSEKAPDRFIPKRLEEICLRAVEPDRDKRYQTVMEFVNDIREFRQETLVSSSG